MIYTIGYSGFYNIEDFINTLKDNGINVVIDVRSTPFSAHFEAYNRDKLEPVLKNNGIYYRNYANEFGARQSSHSFYIDGRLDFSLFSKSEQFKCGVKKIEDAVNKGFVPCFMCAEKDPTDCHRANLVTRSFAEAGYDVTHLMPLGETKTQNDVVNDLLNKLDIFDRMTVSSEEDEINLAYRKQNDAIGFREENLK